METNKTVRNESTARWYASGGGIARTGPYSSQHDAYLAMRLTAEARLRQREATGSDSPYPVDLVIWPEWEGK